MSQATVKLIPMQCVRCQQAIPAQPDEVVWVCSFCGQGQVLSDEKGLLPQTVHYAAGIPANMAGKPVWVAAGQVTLHRETYHGNNERDMQQFWAQPRWFFIPAYNLTLEQLSTTGVNLLKQPIPLQEVETRSPFLPITVHPEDIRPLAEFIILAVEAERSDQLRNLTYDLKLGPPDLWIFA
jgi:predicted RNA-binding Zn-ribbon protein involved in translation (DUF1610 family)